MNKESETTTYNIMDLIAYNDGYAEGYKQCKAEYKQRIRERRETKYAERRRRLYFLKQNLIGVLLLVGTIVMMRFLEGDVTIALFTVPVSLILIFGKEKSWMDEYYFETEEERERR